MATFLLRRRSAIQEIGIAIGRRMLCVSAPGNGVRIYRELVPWSEESTSWPSLEETLASLQEEHRVAAAGCAVALLPDLLYVSQTDSFGLRRSDMQRMLESNATRLFNSSRSLKVIALPQRAGNVLGIAVDLVLLDAIECAIERRGWKLRCLVPAYTAWMCTAQAVSEGDSQSALQVVIGASERVDTLTLQDGHIAGIRRARTAESAWPSRPQEELQMVVIGEAHITGPMVSRMSNARRIDEPAEMVAAEYAAIAPRQMHWYAQNASARRTIRRKYRDFAVAVVVAALCGFGISADAQLRENRLLEISRQRAAISDAVAQAQDAQQRAVELERSLAALSDFEAATPTATSLVAEISKTLPALAFLTSFKLRGDSIALRVVAYSAHAVMAGLGSSEHLRQLALSGPVQRHTDSLAGTREVLMVSAAKTGRSRLSSNRREAPNDR